LRLELERATISPMKEELADIRRRLGPLTALQREDPWRLNDAEIARALVRLVDIVEKLAEQTCGPLDEQLRQDRGAPYG